MLNQTALAFVTEAGRGLDPEAGSKSSPHSTENMAVLICGRAGGLQGSAPAHPAQVLGALMNAVGVKGSLGESGEPLTEVFS